MLENHFQLEAQVCKEGEIKFYNNILLDQHSYEQGQYVRKCNSPLATLGGGHNLFTMEITVSASHSIGSMKRE